MNNSDYNLKQYKQLEANKVEPRMNGYNVFYTYNLVGFTTFPLVT